MGRPRLCTETQSAWRSVIPCPVGASPSCTLPWVPWCARPRAVCGVDVAGYSSRGDGACGGVPAGPRPTDCVPSRMRQLVSAPPCGEVVVCGEAAPRGLPAVDGALSAAPPPAARGDARSGPEWRPPRGLPAADGALSAALRPAARGDARSGPEWRPPRGLPAADGALSAALRPAARGRRTERP